MIGYHEKAFMIKKNTKTDSGIKLSESLVVYLEKRDPKKWVSKICFKDGFLSCDFAFAGTEKELIRNTNLRLRIIRLSDKDLTEKMRNID